MVVKWDPPRSRDIYLWADFVELLCLASNDGLFSRSDLQRQLDQASDLGEFSADGVSADGVDTSGEGSNSALGSTIGEPAIGSLLHIADVFDHLAYRAGVLGRRYPFRLRRGRAAIEKTAISKQHYLYLFLLLAASLPRISRKWYPPVTTSFERLLAQALHEWLPGTAKIHVFGTSRTKTARYRGSLFAKLSLLSSDLAETLRLTEEDIRRGDAGDAGADVVAWLGIGDNNSGRLIILAQAACGQNWVEKQHESGAETWSAIINFTAPHTNVVAIPYFYRRSGGEWAWRRYIRRSILFDRLRLMWLLRDVMPKVPADTVRALLKARVPA